MVVVTGAGGKAFVSGADISKFADGTIIGRGGQDLQQDRGKAGYATVHEFPKPTIAMIRGYCIGGGMGLAELLRPAHLLPTTRSSRFRPRKLGLGYAYPGVKRLIDIVGPSFTKEIFFTARQFDAAEAREMGLVNRVVEADKLEDYVSDYAQMISANAPLTVDSIKFIVGEAVKDADKRDMQKCADLVATASPARTMKKAARRSWKAQAGVSVDADSLSYAATSNGWNVSANILMPADQVSARDARRYCVRSRCAGLPPRGASTSLRPSSSPGSSTANCVGVEIAQMWPSGSLKQNSRLYIAF